MEVHRFANIFPMIEGEELERLKEDIKEHGLLNPIIVFENKILDGRNRFKACQEIGIKPEFKNYDGNKPLEFVISLNLKRRHLTPSQVGTIGQNILEIKEQEAKERWGGDRKSSGQIYPLEKKGRASIKAQEVLKKMGMIVGEKYLRDAKKLKETSPELFEEVREIFYLLRFLLYYEHQ